MTDDDGTDPRLDDWWDDLKPRNEEMTKPEGFPVIVISEQGVFRGRLMDDDVLVIETGHEDADD